jgi:hypothetical protein
MRPLVALALVACSHASQEPRGDWCGTERAEIRYAGELLAKCDAGDFIACDRAKERCAAGGDRFFCAEAPPKSIATPAELRARLASGCRAGDSQDCLEHGELLDRDGDNPQASYQDACDRGLSTGCGRVSELVAKHAREAEDTGDFREAGRLYRLGCYKHNNTDACTALEQFRQRGKHEATECEAYWQRDVCVRAADILRATSQGPADEARAEAIKRRFSL